MAHISIQSLNKLLDTTISDKINLSSCPICLKSKYHRFINKWSNNLSQYDILDRIHSDIGGPIQRTYNNYRYYISMDKTTSDER